MLKEMTKRCALAVALAGVLGACATSPDPMLSDIRNRVAKLNTEMDQTIPQLTKNTAELSARVDASDQNTRILQTKMEETQMQLQNLSASFEDFKSTYFRRENMTPPATSRQPTVDIIAPPTPTAPTPPAQPAVTPPPGEIQPMVEAPEPAAETPVPVTTVPNAAQVDPQKAYQDAQQRYMSEDYQGALTQFDQFLQKYPTSELAQNAQFWKAKSYLNLERYQEAIQEFEGLRQRYPAGDKAPFVLHNQAVAHSRLGQNDAAIRLLQQVIDEYPLSPAAEKAKTDLQTLTGG